MQFFQFVIFILVISLFTSSSHLFLGLPSDLVSDTTFIELNKHNQITEIGKGLVFQTLACVSVAEFKMCWCLSNKQGWKYFFLLIGLSYFQAKPSYVYPSYSQIYSLFTYLPMKMEQCSETSAYKIQTPENYPEENIQQVRTGWRKGPLVKISDWDNPVECSFFPVRLS